MKSQSNHWEIWDSERLEVKRAVAKLTVVDQLDVTEMRLIEPSKRPVFSSY